jgi:flavin reductase (DIM6/NTAB) family NADH-FMN oxidoreductase RutF
MIIDLGKLGSGDTHGLMAQAIIPRPIAWVLSDNGNGTWNFAPFSFFTGVCSDPPLVMISVGRRPYGAKKDTWVNIEERSDFVIHLADTAHGQEVSNSSTSIPHGESELDLVGMATEPVEGERLPRVIGPKVAMFCTRHAIHEVGNKPQGLILGEIHRIWLDDDVVQATDDSIQIDAAKLEPLSRLGGIQYADLGQIREIAKPN